MIKQVILRIPYSAECVQKHVTQPVMQEEWNTLHEEALKIKSRGIYLEKTDMHLWALTPAKTRHPLIQIFWILPLDGSLSNSNFQ